MQSFHRSPLTEELNRHVIFPHTLMQNGVIFCSKRTGYCRLYNLLFCCDAAVHHRICIGAPRARLRRKFGNLSMREILVLWP